MQDSESRLDPGPGAAHTGDHGPTGRAGGGWRGPQRATHVGIIRRGTGDGVTERRGGGRPFPWAMVLAALAVAGAGAPWPRTAFAQTPQTAQPAAPPPATPAPGPKPPEPKPEEEKKTSPWSNSTELSLVWTAGNSDVQTLGFKNTLEYKQSRGRTRIRLDTLRSDTSDDPYLLVEPGLTFLPGETPTGFTTREVRPGAEQDVARYFAEGKYEGNLSKEARWYRGATGATL